MSEAATGHNGCIYLSMVRRQKWARPLPGTTLGVSGDLDRLSLDIKQNFRSSRLDNMSTESAKPLWWATPVDLSFEDSRFGVESSVVAHHSGREVP